MMAMVPLYIVLYCTIPAKAARKSFMNMVGKSSKCVLYCTVLIFIPENVVI